MPSGPTDPFERTTSRWGRWTMFTGLVISLAGPMYLMFGMGHWPGFDVVAQSWIAVAAVFGVIWIVEPIAYYPMLGSAATYQAFMIGNIANKLLPSAVAAQQALGAKQGTKKSEITAVVAITGAAAVHLVSLLVFVGILGTWMVSIIPPAAQEVFGYVVPAIFGPVLVQAAMAADHLRTVVFAVSCGVVGVFVLVPLVPSTEMYAMALCVLAAVALALTFRPRATTADDADEKTEVPA